ncbi:hypothetical protein BJX68DRAFT_157617 [Aspergillus pseudodeflectus]|uniref:Uncharacterized protein n=1 Tax=Aspergillus pseudodeflectus TaxID=176178 RepID=A0ABR4JVS7_9EURO
MTARLEDMLVRSDDKPPTAPCARTMHAVEKSISLRRPNRSTVKMATNPPNASVACKHAENILATLPEGLHRVTSKSEVTGIDEMDFSSRLANLMAKRIAAFQASVLPPLEDARWGAMGSARNDVALRPTEELSSHPAQKEMEKFSAFAMDSLFDPTVAPFGASGTYISSGARLVGLFLEPSSSMMSTR